MTVVVSVMVVTAASDFRNRLTVVVLALLIFDFNSRMGYSEMFKRMAYPVLYLPEFSDIGGFIYNGMKRNIAVYAIERPDVDVMDILNAVEL